MANYGPFGDPEALKMSAAPPSAPEQRQDGVLKAIGFKGGPREEEYERWKREFAALAQDCKVTEAAFVEHTMQSRWGIDADTASAAFRAADVDGSKMLNTHEYALLRAALTTYDSSRDDKTVLNELRSRILFTKYAGLPNARMDASQRVYLLRDLCAGPSHVSSVVKALGWPADDKEGQMSCAEFLSAVKSGRLAKAGLCASDAFHALDNRIVTPSLAVAKKNNMNDKKHKHAKKTGLKLVLDPRCVVSDGSRTMSHAVGSSFVNADLVLDDALRVPHGADWRGTLAAPRGAASQSIAAAVVEQARDMAVDLARDEDDFELADSAWMTRGKALALLLGTDDEMLQAEYIDELSKDARRIVSAQPSVATVPTPPVKIFGDTHGQLRDLLLLLGFHGFPSHRGGDVECVSYVFNGDFVDRGAHQLDVVVFLFALKVLYPARVFLIRGNHEFRRQNEGMGDFGFYKHIQNHFEILAEEKHTKNDDDENDGRGDDDDGKNTVASKGDNDKMTSESKELADQVYQAIHSAFDWLPLAAVIADCIFVVHGGIGDGSWCVDDLANVRRPISDAFATEVPACVRHALWSDPSDSDADMARGVHFPARGEKGYRGSGIPKFGPDITKAFCDREQLQLIVRSHQFTRSGIKFMHGGHLATLFSARNYFDAHSNDSALLLVTLDEQGALRVRAKRLAHICGTNNCDNHEDLIPS